MSAKGVFMLTKISLKFTHGERKFAIWGCICNYPFIVQESESDVGTFRYGIKAFLNEHVDSIIFAWRGESNAYVC